MTELLKITTLTAAIAAQTITVTDATGTSVALNIRDVSAVPAAVNQQDCPMLTPDPDGFVSNLTIMRDTMGADAAYKTARYTLNYKFYFAPIGQSVTLFEHYGDGVTAMQIILMYFANHANALGTTLDFIIRDVPHFGKVSDANGTNFHGAQISFDVTQLTEV